jgi:formylglycine-generating enzyme required for sulfatase activity
MKGVMMAGAVVLLLARVSAAQCPPDAVLVGNACVDRYEASVWRIPDTLANKDTLIAAIQAGMLTSALQLAGAQRRGENGDDYGACTDTGGGTACTKVYAVSIPGVRPSRYITWFQAAVACRNAGKRLVSNYDWQMAALGTPDPGTDNDSTDCNITDDGAADPTNTGARSLCRSDVGAYDMVGNLWEWVGDLVDRADGCDNWSATFGSDVSCIGGSGSSTGTNLPGALIRGGNFSDGSNAGVFAADGSVNPSNSYGNVGFRCAREL